MKEKNVVEFYVLTNKLKDIIRTGWKVWGIKRERIESVAEHIFGVQMLAIAMWSEFKYDIDLKKVILMLALHETEEIVIGDYTTFQITKEEKDKLGEEAVKKIFSNLTNAKEIEDLIYEFDRRETKEARFAYFCDKLECDLQCKLYDEENCVDLSNQKDNEILKDQKVSSLIRENKSLSLAWLKFWQEKAGYDENFLSVSKYAMNNDLIKK